MRSEAVKNRIALLITGIALSWAPLGADYDLGDAGSEEITQETQNQYTLSAKGDWVMKSKHRDHDYGGHIDYNHEELNFSAVVYYDKCLKEGLSLGLDLEHTHLDWDENPFFQRKSYETLAVSLSYFTHRLSGWRWLLQGTINIDADKWQFSDYTDYNILLWGRYDYCYNLGLHFGFYAETGMKLDRVWPILGFDWTINEKWQLNAVYPLNVSVIYKWNDMWSFALAGRVFNERQRAGKSGGFYEAVWRYQNTGAEIAINNTWCSWLQSNIHAGYTFGGKLKVANRNAHHSHRFKFDSAAYFGGEVTASF
jgi:hypothetical protein